MAVRNCGQAVRRSIRGQREGRSRERRRGARGLVERETKKAQQLAAETEALEKAIYRNWTPTATIPPLHKIGGTSTGNRVNAPVPGSIVRAMNSVRKAVSAMPHSTSRPDGKIGSAKHPPGDRSPAPPHPARATSAIPPNASKYGLWALLIQKPPLSRRGASRPRQLDNAIAIPNPNLLEHVMQVKPDRPLADAQGAPSGQA